MKKSLHWLPWGILLASMVFLACRTTPAPDTRSQASTSTAAPAPRSPWEDLVQTARKEGNLTIYGAELGAARDAIRGAFKEKFGINIDAMLGRPAETLARLTAERRAGLYLADIGLMGNSTFIHDIKPLGITVPLASLLILPEVTDTSKWRNGKIPYIDKERYSIAVVAMAVPSSIYNVNLVKEGEITSFLDYLEPKWKGKIVLSDPAVAGTSNNFFTLMAREIFGMERTMDILRQLAAQEPFMTRDQRLMLDWVAKGKYPVGIGQSSSMFAEFKRLGAPIAFAKLKEPPFVSSGAGNIFVFDKAPHPNTAKLFLNWLLSREGSSVWSPAQGYPSQRLDVSKEEFDPMLIPPPEANIPDEAYLIAQGEMRKIAGETFAGLRK